MPKKGLLHDPKWVNLQKQIKCRLRLVHFYFSAFFKQAYFGIIA
jgi:hypothetical protein